MTDWISVNDRLPKPRVKVWIFGKTGYCDIEFQTSGYYDDDSDVWFDWSSDYMENSVTHWQPLPEAPK